KDISVRGLKQQHHELFGNIYDWAGNFRDYTTGRGLPFCRPEFIENELNKIYTKVNNSIRFGVSEDIFISAAAEFIGDLNAIHPFIEGNGRTQRLSLSFLAKKANYIISPNKLDKDSWYKAAEISHIHADYSIFQNIIKNSLSTNKIQSQKTSKDIQR
ncbi:MAG: Fic family protein, partial [Pasteurella sp.]|nr:Fic family protein [Pasteurella sp.]